MKKNFLKLSGSLFFLLLVNTTLAQDSSEIIRTWLKQHCVPIKSIKPGSDISDLQFLKPVLNNVELIGLGECTHGTSEFVQIKHRLIQFLVQEMGFTAFALESSYSDCEPINDYILTGKGSLADAITGQGYTGWDTEEFTSILEWMRQYNKRAPEERKVHFYGIDIPVTFQKTGREKVKAYLKKYAPEKLPIADSIFRVLGDETHSWPTRLNEPALEQVYTPLHELSRYFNTSKATLVAKSSPGEWEHTRKYLEVMEQGLMVNTDSIPVSLIDDSLGRDDYMAQNLLYLLRTQKPDSKFIFWAHNGHVSSYANGKSVGFYMKQWLQNKYYALGLECYDGRFTARELLPDGAWGDLKADTLFRDKKTFIHYLQQLEYGSLFVDWRQASDNFFVDKWLDTPDNFGEGNWKSRKTEENFELKKLKGEFDGLVFIEHSTPTHPTRNAMARSAARAGF
jgi:erythromycin esterase